MVEVEDYYKWSLGEGGWAVHLVAGATGSFQGVSGGISPRPFPLDKEMLRSRRGQTRRRQAVGIYTLHFVFMGLSSV